MSLSPARTMPRAYAGLAGALIVGMTIAGSTLPAFADDTVVSPADVPTVPTPDASDIVEAPAAHDDAIGTLATDVNVSITGTGNQSVTPGQSIRLGFRVQNNGSIAIPANRTQPHWSLDKGAVFGSQAVSAVHNGGSANRSCARPNAAQIDCVGQSNPNTIATSGAGNYTNFYIYVNIPADAVPGTIYMLTTTLGFDESLYNNLSSQQSTVYTFTVPLNAPIIDGPAVDTTVGARPTITGAGVPAATVHILDGDGAELGTATVGSDGTWSFVPENPLPSGITTLRAWQHSVDIDSTETTSPTFTVDATAPAAPVIIGPTNGSTLPGDTAEITGTGEAGAHLVIRDGGGTVVCETDVLADGSFSCAVNRLDIGSHTWTATQTDPYDNESASSSVTAKVAPEAPAFTGPTEGETVGTTPEITGTGIPGATVRITDGSGTELGTAIVDEDGTWTFTPTAPLPGGDTALRATQEVNGAGSAPADSDPFLVDAPAPAPAPVVKDTQLTTLAVAGTPIAWGTIAGATGVFALGLLLLILHRRKTHADS